MLLNFWLELADLRLRVAQIEEGGKLHLGELGVFDVRILEDGEL